MECVRETLAPSQKSTEKKQKKKKKKKNATMGGSESKEKEKELEPLGANRERLDYTAASVAKVLRPAMDYSSFCSKSRSFVKQTGGYKNVFFLFFFFFFSDPFPFFFFFFFSFFSFEPQNVVTVRSANNTKHEDPDLQALHDLPKVCGARGGAGVTERGERRKPCHRP
jgi:hypothetical protein